MRKWVTVPVFCLVLAGVLGDAAAQAPVVQSETKSIPSLSDHSLTAACPPGKKVTGGGYTMAQNLPNFYVTSNRPDPTGVSWYVNAMNTSNMAYMSELHVYALCQ